MNKTLVIGCLYYVTSNSYYAAKLLVICNRLSTAKSSIKTNSNNLCLGDTDEDEEIEDDSEFETEDETETETEMEMEIEYETV